MVLNTETPVRTALWAIPVSELGGVARHVLDVVGTGVPGWRIVVLTPPGPLAERLREIGAAVIAEPFGPDHGVLTSIRTLRRAVRHLRPEIVHTHLSYADIIAALALNGRSPKLISTEHGIAANDLVYHGNAWRSRAMATVHHLRQRRLTAIIAVSYATKKAIQDKWRPPAGLPIEVIHNGIDLPDVPPHREPGIHIASISRLEPEKGIDVVIGAFASVLTEHPEARLTVAGLGSLAEDLAKQAAALGIAYAVDFPGYVDVDHLLTEVDVVTQLSVWENCSYALLDAIRAGCGVVATAVGGNPEILPRSSLVPLHDLKAIATRTIEQGLDIRQRPGVPANWFGLVTMTHSIASSYGYNHTDSSNTALAPKLERLE